MMKHCKYCGEEIHEQASFCPYCMNKLIVTETASKKKQHPWKAAIWIMVCVAVAAACLLCIFIFILHAEQNVSEVSQLSETDTIESTDTTKVSENAETSIDYVSYIGTWYSKEITNPDDINTDGGSAVQIFSIDDRIAEISLTTVQSAPANRIATTDKMYGEVDGNVITFHFQNDGWMSSGDGTITLLNDTIYAEVVYTYKDPSALWSLDHANIFYLLDSEISD